jgi:hypothetical protein
MNQEEAITAAINAINTASHIVWRAAMREQIIEGCVGAGMSLLFFILAFALRRHTKKMDEVERMVGTVFTCALATIGLVTLWVTLPTLLNPEFAAMQDIAGMLKGGR